MTSASKPLRPLGLLLLVLAILLATGCTVDLKEGYRRYQQNHPFFGPEESSYPEPIPQGEPEVPKETSSPSREVSPPGHIPRGPSRSRNVRPS